MYINSCVCISSNWNLIYRTTADEEFNPGTVTAIAVNSKGYVVGINQSEDYYADGSVVEGEVDFGTQQFDGEYAFSAVFMNPVKK